MSGEQAFKILVYTQGLPINGEDPVDTACGGSEAAAVSMARALSRQGHTVAVCCRTDRPRHVAGVHFFPLQNLAASSAAQDWDVFISSRHHNILQHEVRARLTGLWHHDMVAEANLDWMDTALAKSGFSLFVSRFQLEAYEQRFRGISRHSLVTSNGVDFDAMDGVAREASRDGAALRFIYASRPERGLHFLLSRIWPRLRDRYPEAELLVTTYQGVQADHLRPYYEACDLLMQSSPGVRSLGTLARRDFWRVMAGCEALVYPTDFPETSCMVALEAQALGVPIVTSGRFALPETVACGATLVDEPWGSEEYVASFVAKVSRLVEDEAFAGEARDAGLCHVSRQSHSWDGIATQWIEYFHRLFAERFTAQKAGILRRLLRSPDPCAALHLVDSEPAAAQVFDPADLDHLQRLAATASPRVTDELARFELGTKLLRMPPRPKISAALLVKNEESRLRSCVESIADVVDEIILGDTGSTDRTIAVAEEMGFQQADRHERPELLRKRIVRIDFRDFAQARNDLAKHATGDYIFWQDADEVLVNPEQLRKWVDDNVYYDGFSWEQRHAMVDGSIAPDRPVRCFKRRTQDGSPGWFGCIHEVVGYGLNQGLRRIFPVPDVYVAHVGYLYESVRREKTFGRNFPLLVRDRRENPDRCLGYLLGLREYLNLAKAEIGGPGGAMTGKAYRYLNYGFEIWDERIRHLAEPFRRVGYEYSREILALLAQFRLPLRKSGRVPFWAKLSIGAGYVGSSGTEGSISAVFSSIEELRETAETNLRAVEQWMSQQMVGPPQPIRIDRSPQWQHLDLLPELFGIEP